MIKNSVIAVPLAGDKKTNDKNRREIFKENDKTPSLAKQER